MARDELDLDELGDVRAGEDELGGVDGLELGVLERKHDFFFFCSSSVSSASGVSSGGISGGGPGGGHGGKGGRHGIGYSPGHSGNGGIPQTRTGKMIGMPPNVAVSLMV